VRGSDGIVVFTWTPNAAGGSLRTIEFAAQYGKPCIHLANSGSGQEAHSVLLQRFVTQHYIRILNVAGSRAREEPGIYQWVTEVMENAFFGRQNCRGVWRKAY
jgi:hypothetical protein